jgi:septal ring factor EnvC (AmiA/AmiB activator)
MIRAPRLVAASMLALVLAPALPGCQFGARRQLDECRRLSQTLRSQNDQLKDQMLAYRSQYEDATERAVDDARRLSQQEETIAELERSVHHYQDERDELQAAFRELRDGLPAAVRAALSSPPETDSRTADASPDEPRPLGFKTSPTEVKPRPRRVARARPDDGEGRRAGWAPASAAPEDEPDQGRADP